ncbi:MAG TPA: hydroxyisourate hydrolase [Pyrinomonadaceae bacterium]|nr:hydroxyisourate hydrolase [Pyrinomonadaceae bacterium]
MSRITTHVLDTARGRPAAGVAITLEVQNEAGDWRAVGRGRTDADGRLKSLAGEGEAQGEGVYRLTFETGDYFSAQGVETFYPLAVVVFRVRDASEHYHVPLLVSPFGYSTYRGS